MFFLLLAVIGLPALIVALVPDHSSSAEATVLAGGPDADASASTALPSTTVEASSTSSARSVVTTKASPTTAKPTTTTSKPVTTTTVGKAPAAPLAAPKAAGPTTAAPAPAAPPPAASGSAATPAEQATLACLRRRESGGNYQVVGGGGMYFGAYQFLQSSWDSTARHAGRLDLVGIPPNQVSPADQDAMALELYRWQGSGPWGGACG